MALRLALPAIGCEQGSLPRPIVPSVTVDVGLAFPLLSVLLLGISAVEARVSTRHC